MQNPVNPFAYSSMGPIVASALDVFAHVSAPRGKPEFGIECTIVDGEEVAVHEEVVLRKPFGQLKHFRKDGAEGGPRLLIVAPMSRSEEHTSELQSLMRISYAVFCLKKKKHNTQLCNTNDTETGT